MGFTLGLLVRLAFPEEFAAEGIGKLLAIALSPLGVAIGLFICYFKISNLRGIICCRRSW